MLKGSRESKKQHRWRISRMRSTRALFLGYVYAPDEKTALQQAIKEFQVTRPARSPDGTRRSSTRGTPRALFGNIGLMAAHSSSESS
jgi:hypothetical protein